MNSMRLKAVILGLVIGSALLSTGSLAGPFSSFPDTERPAGPEGGDSPRRHAMALYDAGRFTAAAVLLDSLVQTDREPASFFWTGRAWEAAGEPATARCRYLVAEGVRETPGIVHLAVDRRWRMERLEGDREAWGGSSPTPDAGARPAPPPRILLLPLDDVGDGKQASHFGLAWAYLLIDALRGTGLCTVSMPALLVALDQLHGELPRRAPVEASRLPATSAMVLQSKLSILPSRSGQPYVGADEPVDLRGAIYRFQRDQDLPRNGEADDVTMARLEEAVTARLLELPAPVATDAVPDLARRFGASYTLGGTFAIEEARISLRLVSYGPDGKPTSPTPWILDFRPEDAVATAFRLAGILVSELGGAPVRDPGFWQSPLELSESAQAILLLDRGMPDLATRRWIRPPLRWVLWPLLDDLRAVSTVRPEELEAEEISVRETWLRRARLIPEPDLEVFLDALGGVGEATDEWGWGIPGPYGILGPDGLLRIRGERP